MLTRALRLILAALALSLPMADLASGAIPLPRPPSDSGSSRPAPRARPAAPRRAAPQSSYAAPAAPTRRGFANGERWVVIYVSSGGADCNGSLYLQSERGPGVFGGYMDLTCTLGGSSDTTRQTATVVDQGSTATINFSNPTRNGQSTSYNPDNYQLTWGGPGRLNGRNVDSAGHGGPVTLVLPTN